MIKRWNTVRIAVWGAAFGVLYTLMRKVVEQGTLPSDAYFYGGIFGGAVGGAMHFALVSGARNLVLRAK
ncbi:MAG TPA: hypothetical protein VK630_18105 [Reyranella sp.]|nr:hypothetical protein [Reyranella sp.]